MPGSELNRDRPLWPSLTVNRKVAPTTAITNPIRHRRANTLGRLHASGKRHLVMGLPFLRWYRSHLTGLFIIGGLFGRGVIGRTTAVLPGFGCAPGSRSALTPDARLGGMQVPTLPILAIRKSMDVAVGLPFTLGHLPRPIDQLFAASRSELPTPLGFPRFRRFR